MYRLTPRCCAPLARHPTQASITSPEHLAAYADYCKRALSNAVNGPLLGKRDAVLHQLSRVQGRTDELRAVSADVERAVRATAEDAVEQLRGVEARRQALLSAQAEELCRTLEALDGAAAAAAAACAAAEPPLVFLQRFRALTDTCERLAMKPLREDIEVRAALCCCVGRLHSQQRRLLPPICPRCRWRSLRLTPERRWPPRRSGTRRCCRSC